LHEYSIVQSLLDSCEEIAISNKKNKVSKITIKVGVASGVEPQLLQTAFDTFKADTMCSDAALKIDIQNIKVLCQNCQKESEIKKFEYICPLCKSEKVKPIDGQDMYLMRVEL